MLGVFERFLKKELGRQTYEKYCSSFDKYRLDKSIQNRITSSQTIYDDLYESLKDQDIAVLQHKLERLINSMCESVNISKYYMFSFFFYLGCSLFLIFQNLDPQITIFTLILMSGAFIFKTCEFVANKYCFVDANIVLVYKSVLDQLIARERKHAGGS